MTYIFVTKTTDKKWKKAQELERDTYDYGNVENCSSAANIILTQHFNLDPSKDLVGKKILESGGGSYPVMSFCEGISKAVNVEPLYESFPQHIKDRLTERKIETVSLAFEDYETDDEFDEVWFFNVLQHVKDPYLQIQNAKSIAKIIRVFEPINAGKNEQHPHEFDMYFFEKQFPEAEVKKYSGGTIAGFHGANCAYLTWRKES